MMTGAASSRLRALLIAGMDATQAAQLAEADLIQVDWSPHPPMASGRHARLHSCGVRSLPTNAPQAWHKTSS